MFLRMIMGLVAHVGGSNNIGGGGIHVGNGGETGFS